MLFGDEREKEREERKGRLADRVTFVVREITHMCSASHRSALMAEVLKLLITRLSGGVSLAARGRSMSAGGEG